MRYLMLLLAIALSTPLQAQTRDVVDDAGRTIVIPTEPRRVIALFEPLLGLPLIELGIPVVGLYGRAADGSTLMGVDFMREVLGKDARTLNISGIGAVGNIDLEKVRALQPDLIVASERQHAQAEMLSPIAPVYLQNTVSEGASGFSVEERLATVMNREAAFAERKAKYRERVAAVAGRLPSTPTGQTYLAVIIFDQIGIVRDVSGAIQAIHDLGYQETKIPDGLADNRTSSGFSIPISPEAFGRLNPDLLVVMNSFMAEAHSETDIRTRLDALVPGWDRFMKAAREDRILFVDSRRLATPTIASAHHMLDAFEAWIRR